MGLFNGYIKPGKGVKKKDVVENFGFLRKSASAFELIR